MTASVLMNSSETALRVSEHVQSASSRGVPQRIAGAASWLHAGAPVESEGTISLARDSGVIEYVPGDLTLTVLAGTSLATIRATVGRDKQWLALDPLGSADGTIGATIATGSYGPLAQMYGTPRDHLLGIEFVSGSGDIARGGGRVTKNVAGFDLSRLMCGAWGTLGVITEVTLRLRAIPDRDVTVATQFPSGKAADVAQLLARVRGAALSPAALEFLNPSACAALGVDLEAGSSGALLARFCGNADGVAVQLRRFRNAFDSHEYSPQIWSAFTERSADSAEVVFRLSSRPTQLPALWEYATTIAQQCDAARLHACVGRGVVRCVLPRGGDAALGDMLGRRPPDTGIGMNFEQLPAALWPSLAPAAGMADRLSTRVRDAFDPQRILNRGILGESPV